MSAPLSGMTGFGRAEAQGPYGVLSVEARSVNGKGLDFRLRVPSGMDALEIPLRDRTRARFQRGSVTLTVTLSRTAGDAGVRVERRAWGPMPAPPRR